MFAGGPGAFSAGSDIGDFQKRAEGGLEPITVDFLHALARNQKPLVAAVGGLAVGIGTTMLLHCDYVVAAAGATFVDAVHQARPHSRSGVEPAGADAHGPCARLLDSGDGPSALRRRRQRGPGFVNDSRRCRRGRRRRAEGRARNRGAAAGAVAVSRRLLRGDLDDVVERIDTEAMHFQERLQSDEARAAFAAFFARKK